jgi:tetratricopeptide (TPR) repeat protein
MQSRSTAIWVALLAACLVGGVVRGAKGQTGNAPPGEPGMAQATMSVDSALAKAEELIHELEQSYVLPEDSEDRYAAAAKLSNTVLEVEPLNVRARYLQGRLANLRGRPREALPLIEAYVNDPLGASDWYARTLLGDLYVVSYPQHAITQFRDAVRLAPEEAGPHAGLARAYVKLSNGEEAVDNARQAIRFDKQDRAAYHKTLAEALLLLDDRFDEAARAILEAIRITERRVRENPGETHFLTELKGYYDLLVSCRSQQFALYPDRADVVVEVIRTALDQADLDRLIAYHGALQTVEIGPRERSNGRCAGPDSGGSAPESTGRARCPRHRSAGNPPGEKPQLPARARLARSHSTHHAPGNQSRSLLRFLRSRRLTVLIRRP